MGSCAPKAFGEAGGFSALFSWDNNPDDVESPARGGGEGEKRVGRYLPQLLKNPLKKSSKFHYSPKVLVYLLTIGPPPEVLGPGDTP